MLADCPPWILVVTGYGLGSMTRQSLQRLLQLVGASAEGYGSSHRKK